jgi:hypothetical protein
LVLKHSIILKKEIMKSMILALSVALNVAFVGISCMKGNLEPDPKTAKGIATSNRALSAPQTIVCTNCSLDDLPLEPAGEFANVVARYRTTHHTVFNNFAKGLLNNSISPNLGTQVSSNFADARTCWFELNRIKKYICLMENYASQLGITPDRLGIRFYYGVYPSQYQRDPRFSDKHTLFLAATYQNDEGEHIDFDPRKSAASGGIVTLQNQVLGNEPSVFVLSPRPASSQTGPNNTLNQGDLCPPGFGCLLTLNAVDNMVPLRPLDLTVHY